MRYLSAEHQPIMHWQHGGLMLTPEKWGIPDLSDVVWAADNGCYTAGERFSVVRWLTFLERLQGRGNCLFAVAPDVPFDMRATLARSMPHMEALRAMGYPAALAIQNGVENVRLEWERFDVAFIAGDKPFKTSRIAYQVICEAKARGKHVHIARRNSFKALQEAYDMGADTVDGTHLRYAPDRRWAEMQQWFRHLNRYKQVDLWDAMPQAVTPESTNLELWSA